MDDDGFETIYPEKDPTGKQLGEAGAKMDAGKEDLLTVMQAFPEALAAVSEIAEYGAEKKGYGWGAWKDVPDGEERYKRACIRHIIKPGADKESKLSHAAHAAWNALAVLSLEIKNKRAK
tara:strand:+ start:855 stop:1214 length:360 start_codon:yes stop_codon:yes gene_type:complete